MCSLEGYYILPTTIRGVHWRSRNLRANKRWYLQQILIRLKALRGLGYYLWAQQLLQDTNTMVYRFSFRWLVHSPSNFYYLAWTIHNYCCCAASAPWRTISERSRQIMSLVMMDSVGFFGCYQNLYISVVPFSQARQLRSSELPGSDVPISSAGCTICIHSDTLQPKIAIKNTF